MGHNLKLLVKDMKITIKIASKMLLKNILNVNKLTYMKNNLERRRFVSLGYL